MPGIHSRLEREQADGIGHQSERDANEQLVMGGYASEARAER